LLNDDMSNILHVHHLSFRSISLPSPEVACPFCIIYHQVSHVDTDDTDANDEGIDACFSHFASCAVINSDVAEKVSALIAEKVSALTGSALDSELTRALFGESTRERAPPLVAIAERVFFGNGRVLVSFVTNPCSPEVQTTIFFRNRVALPLIIRSARSNSVIFPYTLFVAALKPRFFTTSVPTIPYCGRAGCLSKHVISKRPLSVCSLCPHDSSWETFSDQAV
jgi:hypothetical protein